MTSRKPTAPPAPIEHRPLWDVNDVAAFLRISPEVVGLLARRGEIPSKKIGRARRYLPAEIERYVERATA